MSKVDHKGLGKAARKKAKAGDVPPGFELRPVKRREGNGRASRAGISRDPQAEMLKARCRRWGVSQSKWREMRDPWWGCEAGGAMALATPRLDERKAYWDAICYMRRAAVAFDAVIGAPNRHAQVLRLLVPSEAMEANAETPEADERTDEERQDDAVRAMHWVEELTGRAGADAAGEASRAVLDDQRPRDVGAMLSALRQISYGVDPKALTRE